MRHHPSTPIHMLTILAYCPRDIDIMLPLMEWINELGGCKKHDLLLIYDKRCLAFNMELVHQIEAQASKAFNTVTRLEAKAQIDGWPQGANYMFRIGSDFVSKKPGVKHFFWMEPDAIPLKEGWLDALEQTYLLCQKPFMGDRVEVEGIPLHMSGVAVYPNPIHQFAGEAHRAFDLAWDMAAKDQIIPQAHFTELIEHAWKHPPFTDMHELDTQISKQAVIFHASKDGSLIKLLRERIMAVTGERQTDTVKVKTLADSAPADVVLGAGLRGDPVAATISCDIFIRTYPGDYQWLAYCIAAINKFAKGFRKYWVISPSEVVLPMIAQSEYSVLPPHNTQWQQKVLNEESDDGYLSQQIHKLYADVITDYQPDYILHIDSDVILTREITPDNFFSEAGLPVWLFTPYDHVEAPWQPIIEKFMGRQVTNEFMRRLPIMVPKWLYPKLREFCHHQHGRIISEYIRTQPPRAFSEFNALGAYAFAEHHDKFTWINTMKDLLQEPFAKQFRSWDGVTLEVKAEIDTILRGTDFADAVVSSKPVTASSAPVPQLVKVLPNGLWIFHNDLICKWIEESGRLDHDQNLLPGILKHIREGDTVLDIGAFVGDHTIAYARAVGKRGRVVAFEANPVAASCLEHNLRKFDQVTLINVALGDQAISEPVPLSMVQGHYGSAALGDGADKIADVLVRKLDYWHFAPQLIKIDVEGYELQVLKGAERTITENRPKMVLEINMEALLRQGSSSGAVFAWLKDHGYSYQIMQENRVFDSPIYDIYCEPLSKVTPPGGIQPEKAQSPPEVVLPPTELIKRLLDYAKLSKDNTKHVRRQLRKYGLIPKPPKTK